MMPRMSASAPSDQTVAAIRAYRTWHPDRRLAGRDFTPVSAPPTDYENAGEKEKGAIVVGVHNRASYQRGRAAGNPALPGERGRRRLGSDGDPSQKGMAVVWGQVPPLRYGQGCQSSRRDLCADRTMPKGQRAPIRPQNWATRSG